MIDNIKLSESFKDKELEKTFERHLVALPDSVTHAFNPSFCFIGNTEIFCFRVRDNADDHQVIKDYVSVFDGGKYSLICINDFYESQFRRPRSELPNACDPKIFKADGKAYATFNSGTRQDNEIFVVEVYPNLSEKLTTIECEGRRSCEKNWAFYEDKGEVFCLYSIDPLVILQRESIEDESWKMKVVYSEPDKEIINKSISIGTQLSNKINDKYYFFLHEKHQIQHRRYSYTGRLASFDPSKREIRVHKDRWAYSLKSMLGFGSTGTSVFSCIYYAGISIDDSKLSASFGINDRHYGFQSHDISYIDDGNFGSLEDEIVLEVFDINAFGIGDRPEKYRNSRKNASNKMKKAANAVSSLTKGAASTVKTGVFRKDRVNQLVFDDRIKTCTNCPGNYATFKDGKVHTCGKIMESIKGDKETCGCVLKRKARDSKQDCPLGFWKPLEQYEEEKDIRLDGGV